jgi:hypothetical protein
MRYQILTGTELWHRIFGWVIIDTEQEDKIEGNICQAYTQENAQMICAALNTAEEKRHEV